MTYTLKQQKENRKKLVEALRSGTYSQTKGALRDNVGFCCLGVACDIALKNGLQEQEWEWKYSEYSHQWAFLNVNKAQDETEILPDEVKKFYGFLSVSGNYALEGDSDEVYDKKSLTTHNDDDDWSFKMIADIIEDEPKGMFKT